ncbi:MAG: bifunctional ornithine acetyltransferase/N-acetylglutamate synthase, partial [Promethearchaeota archaeon]
MEIKSVGIKKINGSITNPKGFYATGSHIGIKDYKKDLALIYSEVPAKDYKKDLALIYSEVPAKAAGVFTSNIVKASSILWNQNLTQNPDGTRAIVINSGNANACTGEVGIKHTELMATELASCLEVNKNQVLVASTGIIGVPLPIDTIITGIRNTYKKLGNTNLDANLATEAIMTTDTRQKQISVEFSVEGKKGRIGGIAKGSGMIHPNMATM